MKFFRDGWPSTVGLLLILLPLALHLSTTWAHTYHWGKRRGHDHGGRRNLGRHRRKENLVPEIPYFEPNSPTEVEAQLGSSAYLPCKIKNLGNKSVSWVRNKDAHILTVDRYTFISDVRFAAWHDAVTNTWTLQVKYVEESDAGRYECQVSTEPKMSHFVHLAVITPKVSIPGGTELHVRSGSPVQIKCVVSQALQPPSYVFWYHEDSRVPETTFPGVEQVPLKVVSAETSVASINIDSVTQAHAGNYTCAPAALTTASVILHVLNGERPAAMQHGTSPASSILPDASHLLASILLQVICFFFFTAIPVSHLPSLVWPSLRNVMPR